MKPGITLMATRHSLILVDGHVHIYDCFDLPLFLDAAFQNFAVQANKQKASNSFIGILLLTETLGVDRFAGLIACADARDGVENKRIGSWKVELHAEDDAREADQKQDGDEVAAGKRDDAAAGI